MTEAVRLEEFHNKNVSQIMTLKVITLKISILRILK